MTGSLVLKIALALNVYLPGERLGYITLGFSLGGEYAVSAPARKY